MSSSDIYEGKKCNSDLKRVLKIYNNCALKGCPMIDNLPILFLKKKSLPKSVAI